MEKRTKRTGRRRRSGFTLLEVLVAGSVMTVGVVGMAGAMLSSLALQRGEAESATARLAARQALEQLQALEFDEIWRSCNASTADDAGLALAARGPGFAVAGLTPVAGDADGMCGEIQFPDAGGTLREDTVDPGLGLPMDLNGDGLIDSADHSGDYTLLPVRVRIAWRGVAGEQRYELETLLCLRR